MADADPQDERDETPTERADRNWDELLQELRVTQTGVQILFAFLLVLPFQQRFGTLGGPEKALYIAVVLLVTVSTTLNLAPVITHRILFAKHRKEALVTVSNRLAQGSFVTLGLALVGAVVLVIEAVLGGRAAAFTAVGVGLLVLLVWAVLPAWLLRRAER